MEIIIKPERKPLKIVNCEDVSSNLVFFTVNHTGLTLAYKETMSWDAAQLEAKISDKLADTESLSGFIAPAAIEDPFEGIYGYCTVKYFVNSSHPNDIGNNIYTIARTHSHGLESLKEANITVPELYLPEFDQIFAGHWAAAFRYVGEISRLRIKYEKACESLRNCENKTLIVGDPKKDNFVASVIVDCEGFRIGDPAFDLPLPILQNAANISTTFHPDYWKHCVGFYLEMIGDETGRDFNDGDVSDLTDHVLDIAIVPLVKELGGLTRRRMGRIML